MYFKLFPLKKVLNLLSNISINVAKEFSPNAVRKNSVVYWIIFFETDKYLVILHCKYSNTLF